MSTDIYLAVIPTVVSLVGGFWIGSHFANRRRKYSDKLKELDSELEYVTRLRRSSLDLTRKAITHLFLTLFLLALGMLLPAFYELMSPLGANAFIELFVRVVSVLALFIAVLFSFSEFRTYTDVISYEKAVERISTKKKRILDKIENA